MGMKPAIDKTFWTEGILNFQPNSSLYEAQETEETHESIILILCNYQIYQILCSIKYIIYSSLSLIRYHWGGQTISNYPYYRINHQMLT